MIGLCCILSCIVAVEYFAWKQTLFEFIPIVVAAPLLVLCISSIILRQNLRSYIAIERQLSRISSTSDTEDWSLTPLKNASDATVGWNRLIKTLQDGQFGVQLISKLQTAFASSDLSSHQGVLDAIPDILVLTNQEREVRFWNAALKKTVGAKLDSASLNGQSIAVIFAEIAPLLRQNRLRLRWD